MQGLTRHQPPRVVHEVEREIRRLLPLGNPECLGGWVWYTGPKWLGLRVAQWGGGMNVVSKAFLRRNYWKAHRGRISLTVRLGNDERSMEFVAVKDCRFELLLGSDRDHFRVFKGVPLPMSPPSTPGMQEYPSRFRRLLI